MVLRILVYLWSLSKFIHCPESFFSHSEALTIHWQNLTNTYCAATKILIAVQNKLIYLKAEQDLLSVSRKTTFCHLVKTSVFFIKS